jgi:hypothetical protein
MTKPTYLPTDWCDETIPETQEHPDAFLICHNGQWWIAPPENIVGEPEDKDFPLNWQDEAWSQKIADGDIVEFSERRMFGIWEITVEDQRDDRGRIVFAGGADIPVEADHFTIDGDMDTFMDTLEGCLEEHFTQMGEGGVWDVDAYSWVDHIQWRFSIVDGKAGFTQVVAQ